MNFILSFQDKSETIKNPVEISSFLSRLTDLLLKDNIIDSNIYHSLKKNLKNYHGVLAFLYQNYSEKFIKSYISNNFNIDYFGVKKINELSNNSLLSKNSNILSISWKSKILPLYIKNNNLFAVFDNLNKEAHDFFLEHFDVKNIIYIIADKQIIMNFFNKNHENSLINLANNHLKQERSSAKKLQKNLKKNFYKLIFFLLCLGGFSFSSKAFLFFIIILINVIYFSTNLYKLILITLDFIKNSHVDFKKNENIHDIKKSFEFKKFTIFLPVLNEEKCIVHQLISGIKKLNYPHHMLDIYILLEEKDYRTISIIESINLDYIFSTIYIPNFFPKTKAKACNYALAFADGEFLTIYDADDIPHENQLLHVFCEFKKNPLISCIQCFLNSYNHDYNLLTKFYSMEYSIWFEYIMPSLNHLKMPLTLGGTSNHFQLSILKDNPWDSYNVTEDADLGIVFWLKNHEVLIINSHTMEEAPISLKAWINQRSRWTKGFLQTYFVHIKAKNYSHLDFFEKLKFLGWMNFFILLPIVSQASFFIVIIEFFILKFHFQSCISNEYFSKFLIINLFFYYFSQIFILILNQKKFLFKPSVLILIFPLYSMLNIFSTYKAIWQFFTKQYYWEKTLHGADDCK